MSIRRPRDREPAVRPVRAWASAALVLWTACAVPPAGERGGTEPRRGAQDPPAEDQLLVPPGHGSLHQEQITLTLRHGEVQVKVTPLEEWMIRLTAPDTYRRLSALARSHASALAGDRREAPTLVLVSFHSDVEGAAFHPEDLHLESPGRRYAPDAIRPMTGGWGTQRLHGRRPESAVYAFDPGLDFDVDLVAEYRNVRNVEWARILRDLLAEQARARARAGVGGSGPDLLPYASRSYLRSFR